eukprot:10466375-Alexandrium_andersonii.AAC.1
MRGRERPRSAQLSQLSAGGFLGGPRGSKCICVRVGRVGRQCEAIGGRRCRGSGGPATCATPALSVTQPSESPHPDKRARARVARPVCAGARAPARPFLFTQV